MNNYYETLGLTKRATSWEIESKFRELSTTYTSDKQKENTQAQAVFSRIQKAYDVLSDLSLRLEYDQQLEIVLQKKEREEYELTQKRMITQKFEERNKQDAPTSTTTDLESTTTILQELQHRDSQTIDKIDAIENNDIIINEALENTKEKVFSKLPWTTELIEHPKDEDLNKIISISDAFGIIQDSSTSIETNAIDNKHPFKTETPHQQYSSQEKELTQHTSSFEAAINSNKTDIKQAQLSPEIKSPNTFNKAEEYPIDKTPPNTHRETAYTSQQKEIAKPRTSSNEFLNIKIGIDTSIYIVRVVALAIAYNFIKFFAENTISNVGFLSNINWALENLLYILIAIQSAKKLRFANITPWFALIFFVNYDINPLLILILIIIPKKKL